MGHFILPSAAEEGEKVKAEDNKTPFHQKQVAKSGQTNLSKHTKKLCFCVEIAAAAAAADPWRGFLGADDGAAVPVSGVCASVA